MLKSKVRYIVFVCSMFLVMCANAQNNVIDEVIWVVGDQAILKSDVEMARIEGQSRGEHWDGDPYCVIPEQLAIQKLFLHQAAIDSIEVSDNEVLQTVEDQINLYIQNFGSKERMEEIFGKTTTQIREQLFDIVRDNQIMSQERNNLVKDVKVTPAQVRRYFKDVPEDSVPFVPTQLEVQIIVREPKISQEEIDRVKNELRDYTERVNSGQTQFSTLALMYSEDKASAIHGGELGFMGRGSMVPEFANAAFSLTDPKTISKIVETEYGFHIIQLIEKRGDRINVRHILRKPRVSDEELTRTINELDSIANEIRRNVFTFDEATQYISTDKDTRNNHGLMVNPNTGSSKFEMKDLPQEVAKAVVNMNVGEISAPFVMVNNKGKEVVAIVKLKNKVAGHRANIRDDYQLMQDIVHNKLCEEKIDKWIRNMQKTTYVRINDEWKNCEFKYPGWIK